MATDGFHAKFSILPAYKLKGHQSAVLCCAAAGSIVASGAEDGLLLVHDLRSAPCISASTSCTASHSTGTPGPTNQPSAAPAAKPLSAIPLTGADGGAAAIAAVSINPLSPETSVFAAAGSLVHHVDLRTASVVQTYSSNREEVNGLSVSGRDNHLAAGDDAGEVQVYDLTAGRLFKGIRNVHRSLCSSVAFRAHKPWDLLSGGLDSTVAKYDFSRPKCVDRWDMNALTASAGPGGGGGGGGQVFNPPFVHQVAVPPGDARPACQWVAAARGDGAVVVLDADVSSAASGASGPTTQVASSTRGRGSGGRVGGGGGGGQGSAPTGAGRQRGGPMRPLVLDQDIGGHTLPVCSVAFASGSTAGLPSQAGLAAAAAAGCRLYSGGEDCRIVLWDVEGALQARAAGVPLVSPANIRGADGRRSAGGVGREAESGADCGEGGAVQWERASCGTGAGGRDRKELGEGRAGGGGEEGKEEGEGRAAVLAEVRHGRKVNQLCCLELDGRELVAVTAVSKFVTIYRTQITMS